MFGIIEIFVSLQPQIGKETCKDLIIGLWCNGNTTDSGPVIPGSNPGSPTKTIPFFTRKPAKFFV